MALIGALNVLKPPGMTSHDVVGLLRRLGREKRVGHGGTLDPAAAGVLPVCFGEATKALQFVPDGSKVYVADVIFGTATTTQDYTGQPTGASAPANFAVPIVELLTCASEHTGRQAQIPPMVSAVRVGGRKLYEYAREGLEVDRQAREIDIHRIEVLAGPDTITPGSRARLRVTCGRGTYIRTLCHDIGQALGCGAHMGFLLRTRVGAMDITDAWTIEELSALAATPEGLGSALIGVAELLGDIPPLAPPTEILRRVLTGAAVGWQELSASGTGGITPEPGSLVRIMDADRLIAVYSAERMRDGVVLKSVRGFGGVR